MMSDIEMGMDMMPDVLLNYIIKEKTIKDCSRLRKTHEKAMPHYIKRVNENKEFYNTVREKMNLPIVP